MTKKAVIVTGGAKRVGAYISQFFAKMNYDVFIHYNSSHEQAVYLKVQLEKNFNVKVELYQSDFFQEKNFDSLIETAFSTFPHVCVLVNNASIFVKDTFQTMNADIFDKYYTIHIKAPAMLSRKFAELAIEGLVINVLDCAITQDKHKNRFSYYFSKRCKEQLTNIMKSRVEGIKTASLYPGKVISEGEDSYNLDILDLEAELKEVLAGKQAKHQE